MLVSSKPAGVLAAAYTAATLVSVSIHVFFVQNNEFLNIEKRERKKNNIIGLTWKAMYIRSFPFLSHVCTCIPLSRSVYSNRFSISFESDPRSRL